MSASEEKIDLPGATSDISNNRGFEGNVNQVMQSYLRELGNIPKLTAEEQAELAAKILDAENHWRKILYSLAFTSAWQRSYMFSKDPSQWRELFLPSCLNDSIQPDTLRAYMNKLEVLEQKLQESYKHNDRVALEQNRNKLIDELFICKFSSDVLMLCHEQLHLATAGDSGSIRQNLAEESCCTPEEFDDLLIQANLARQKLLDLRKEMVEVNLRLVIRIVNQYSYRHLSVSDLVQEGNIGLMHSLEKFDFNMKHKFSTYASWWIRQSIGRAIAEQFRVIRIPAHMVSTIAAINRVEQRFILEHDRMPEVSEIAAILEMPPARISAIRKMARQSISLQSPLATSQDGSSLEDILPDEHAADPSQKLSDATTSKQLNKLLATLSGREKTIIAMRYGLLGEEVHTLLEISEHFNISRERVRQLEMQALNKLRTPETTRIFGWQSDKIK